MSNRWFHIFSKSNTGPSKKHLRLSETAGTDADESSTIIESIADGVIVVNNEGKIALLNAAAAAISGWSIDESVGIDVNYVFKLTEEDDKAIAPEANPFTQALQNKKKFEKVLKVISRDERRTVVSIIISPVIVDHSTPDSTVGIVAVMRDISVQRQMEQQRSDFISTASHEMRTPVAAIEGYISLAMNDKVASIDSRAKGYLVKAYSSTLQLATLFQDLLTSSKAEDGRLVNHPVIVEMGTYMKQLYDGFLLAAQKKGLAVDFVATANPDSLDAVTKGINPLLYVRIDPDRMREVITNLYDNALKYTEQGKITLGISANEDKVQLFVHDTGAGIPKEDIPHLFQKFYRVDNSAVRTIGGTGLGLYICKKIVDLYNGSIWVESETGKGSTFFIDLPRISTDQAELLKIREKESGEPETKPTLTDSSSL